MREYVTRVCNAVLASEPLAALGTGIPELLAAQLRAAAITDRYVTERAPVLHRCTTAGIHSVMR